MFSDYLGPGSGLSVCEVFLGQPSLRSYTTITECEVNYICILIK